MSQQNKTTLQSAINAQLADNTSGDISAADIRDNLINITDSLLFNSGSQGITGSLTATSFTGSLLGTATTASYVVTAQTASYVKTAQTASYFSGTVNNAVSSSFSTTTNNIFLADTTGLLSVDYPIVIASQNLNNYVNAYGDTSFLTYNPIDSTLKSYVKFEQGYFPTATGNYSHAEGFSTRTTNQYAHAEGYRTLASGESSHSEGFFTTSSGNYSHAEGYITKATGQYAHTEGRQTTASAQHSHAEGQQTHASGYASHAEGAGSIALGNYSHAEGNSTQANGDYSHAEGSTTIASGTTSHAEGQGTQAIGAVSHAEGANTVALGDFSHTEGIGTIASGSSQHVQGQYNIATTDNAAFILGNGTDDNTRSNLIFAAGNTVQITGSLNVNGSITGSLQGTASYAATASYVLPTSPVSLLLHADGVGSSFFSGSGFIVVKEYLIPANTLTTSSILEVSSAIMKDTSTGAVGVYMYMSSSLYNNSLAWATMTTSQPYSAFYRSFAISGSQILGVTPASTLTTDLIVSSLAVVSSSIDITIDNYLQFIINPAGTSSNTRILNNRIIVHK
jgi:hypothetical protein